MANTLTRRMHKGPNTTLDEGQTLIPSGGGFDAVAFSCKDHGADAGTVSPTLRSMGHDESHANGGGQVAVAFKPSHYTRGKDGAPANVVAPLSADADKGDQESVVCVQATMDPCVDEHAAFALGRNSGQENAIGIGVNGSDVSFQPCIAFKANGAKARTDAVYDNVSPTLNSDAGGNTAPRIQTLMQVRRLTPLECERLQGFPDGWTEGFSDSTRYKMLGNAVCERCSRWLALRIAK